MFMRVSALLIDSRSFLIRWLILSSLFYPIPDPGTLYPVFMTRRRWIADTWDEATASLEGNQAAHLIRVLRAQPGMEFDIVAGGRVWHGIVAAIAGGSVRFNLVAEVESDPALPVTLLLSVFKFDRMEWAIEKSTELGAERIVPVVAHRSEKHLAQSAAARAERWRRIAVEASKQARRSDVLQIDDPLPLKTATRAGENVVRLVLAEQERSTTLHHALTAELAAAGDSVPPIRIAIGPEGGWTGEEEALFDAENWKAVSLGPRILRAETAAITAMAIAAALLE
jgi:16S rRNA (uracil1498-N3)-methyltransferase